MEIVLALFALFGSSIAFSVWKKKKTSKSSQANEKHVDAHNGHCYRKCLSCGFEGCMKTWIANYTAPKFIVLAGFVLGYLPGLAFLAFYWGKHKCPGCGDVGKSQQIGDAGTNPCS
jgi:hypothetical protein